MAKLRFKWFRTRTPEGIQASYLLPVGKAKYSRMRFSPPQELEDRLGDIQLSSDYFAFGETIEASAEYVRPILLHHESGAVMLPRLQNPSQVFTLNTSLDLFLSAVALYEVWYERLFEASFAEHEALARSACRIFARLDPDVGSAGTDWWQDEIVAIRRLL